MSVAHEAGHTEEEAAGAGLLAAIAERGYLDVWVADHAVDLEPGEEVNKSHASGFYHRVFSTRPLRPSQAHALG